ncbi:MAG: hypothetical protein Q3988_00760 [Gemella sp.]|nr:hypothetical protein [Gemella sp.]
MNNLLAVFGLSIAGIDPLGMMFLVTALTIGISKRSAYIYGSSVFLGTAGLATLFSFALSRYLEELANFFNSIPNTIWIALDVTIIVILSIWALKRIFNKNIDDEKKSSSKGLLIAALLMIFTAPTDPSLLAVISIAGHTNNLALAFIYNLLWSVLSQIPLALLLLSLILGKEKLFVNKFNVFYKKHKSKIYTTVTTAIIIMVLAFIFDLSYFFITKTWLFE